MDENSKLFKNSLIFPIEKKNVCIGLYFKEQKSLKRIKKERFEAYTSDRDILDQIDEFVWIDIKEEKADAKFTFMLTEQPYLARWWYENQTFHQLREIIRIVRRTFIYEWQYWVEDKTKSNSETLVFKKFNLYFRLCSQQKEIEIVVSYEGKSKVLLKHVQKLVLQNKLEVGILGAVIHEKECKSYRYINEDERLSLDKVYPILRREIADKLDINFEPDIDPLKLSTAVTEIQMFYTDYLQSECIKKHIPIPEYWQALEAEARFQIGNISRKMTFGKKETSTDIYRCFGKYGPYALPNKKKNFKIFIIYTPSGEQAKDIIEKHLNETRGYTNILKYSHLLFNYAQELNLCITDTENLHRELKAYINQLDMDPDTQYFAFYISPYSKYGQSAKEKQYYYAVKEILLKRHITSQSFDESKISNAINYWIPNISMAMIAKMGGVPWKLARDGENELIVGFGAFKTEDSKHPYIGSSFCFDYEGKFQEFDCWQELYEWAFIGQLNNAIKEYRKKNKGIKRLVIHYYKELNKKEFKQVEDLLDLLDANIPIIVVRINSTFNHKELVMDLGHPKFLPVNGSYFHLQYHDYLLYINERQKEDNKNVSASPYPLKLSLQSNRIGLFDEEPELVPQLMQQLYDFSLLHWRSIKQPRLPVTIVYPAYLARIFPHFEAETLQEIGRTSLWFL